MVCMAEEVNEMDDGLQTLVGNGGVRLSGGQGKRLALARTLCHKKPVLVLDDPFSALDKSTETDFCQFESTGEREYCAADFPPSVSVSADESDHLDGRWKNSGGYA